MGVVRREGNWRLEKVDEGLYEVTYDSQTEATITTLDYEPRLFDDQYTFAVRSYDADSYSEVEEIFERVADPDTVGQRDVLGSALDNGNGSGFEDLSSISANDNLDELEDLPPGGIAGVLLLAGGIITYSSMNAVGSLQFYLGAVMLFGGVAIFAWAGVVFRNDGPREAWRFLTTVGEGGSGGESTSDAVERTPPAPQSLKDELYFDRADQQCEWCDDRTDQPEIHHIEPRSEGGPNEPSNLIVLCPDCHAKADRGGISKTKLQSKLKRVTKSA